MSSSQRRCPSPLCGRMGKMREHITLRTTSGCPFGLRLRTFRTPNTNSTAHMRKLTSSSRYPHSSPATELNRLGCSHAATKMFFFLLMPREMSEGDKQTRIVRTDRNEDVLFLWSDTSGVVGKEISSEVVGRGGKMDLYPIPKLC